MASQHEQIKNYSDERLINIIKQSYNYNNELIDLAVSEIKARNLKTDTEITFLIKDSLRENEARKPKYIPSEFEEDKEKEGSPIWGFISAISLLVSICLLILKFVTMFS